MNHARSGSELLDRADPDNSLFSPKALFDSGLLPAFAIEDDQFWATLLFDD